MFSPPLSSADAMHAFEHDGASAGIVFSERDFLGDLFFSAHAQTGFRLRGATESNLEARAFRRWRVL